MAAIIIRRPRLLRSAYGAIPVKNFESKFHNSSDEEISAVLKALASSDVKIATVSVDKYDYNGSCFGVSGNELYRRMTDSLIQGVASMVPNSDVDLMLDRCRFITDKELRSISEKRFAEAGSNLKKCGMRLSEQAPCIQLADYVAGSVYCSLTHDDDRYLQIIRKKIVVARTV
ncbi:hypothetical protein AUP07_1524 [methanogenic archaeon mixed culture ISO4-G1]|nr:hypothetical protein AUP07_1524 [methanogenic archaeon mixed culture ISO4-G1]